MNRNNDVVYIRMVLEEVQTNITLVNTLVAREVKTSSAMNWNRLCVPWGLSIIYITNIFSTVKIKRCSDPFKCKLRALRRTSLPTSNTLELVNIHTCYIRFSATIVLHIISLFWKIMYNINIGKWIIYETFKIRWCLHVDRLFFSNLRFRSQ